ncbi:MAG: prepilin-type N-terminal cleavage/methylation domain-containing protein [candidate division Zixibacteria bacterium]|nr:prepilin-type N-terminal cleavage/methylation domain-containing protein [candidate division Zixibacteria bacterium]
MKFYVLKRIRKLNNQQGISLLEVMVAMILTSLSLMMLLNMAMIALDGNDWSNKTTMATQVMQEKLEQIRGGGMAAMQSGSDTAQGLTRVWTVSSVGSHLRRVEVQVSWSDIKAEQHTNSLTAYIRTDSV